MNGSREHILKGTILRDTEKAVLFSFEDAEGDMREEWFPLSQITSITRTNNLGEDELSVTAWILSAKNIEV